MKIILYMMVTRANPFENESYEQLIKNNLKGEVDFKRLLKGYTRVDNESSIVLPSYRTYKTDVNC